MALKGFCSCDAARMNSKRTEATAVKPDKIWQPMQDSSVIRFVASRTFFAGLRVDGNLIHKPDLPVFFLKPHDA
jgi:hypothetical protein